MSMKELRIETLDIIRDLVRRANAAENRERQLRSELAWLAAVIENGASPSHVGRHVAEVVELYDIRTEEVEYLHASNE